MAKMLLNSKTMLRLSSVVSIKNTERVSYTESTDSQGDGTIYTE